MNFGGDEARPQLLRLAGIAIALLALSLALRAPSFVEAPLDRDEGAYALIAQQWQRGAMPYREYFDHKPPLIYLAYRWSFALGGEQLVAVRICFAVANALTALTCAVVVWLLGGRRAPLSSVLAGIAACVFLNSPLVQGESANTETLMVLGSACGALFLLRGRRSGAAVAAGACAGLAALAKPVALCEAAFFALWLTSGSARAGRGRVAAFGVGLLLPGAGWALYALTQGTLGASVDAVLLYNLRYVGTGTVPLWARLAAIPIDYGLPLTLLWVGVAGCTLTVLRAEPRPANFALGWTLAALLGTIASGRIYDHYYQQLVPPMAVALGVTATAAGRLVRAPVVRGVCVVAIASGLWPPLAATWRFAARLPGAACADWRPRLAAVIGQLTTPGDALLVWGAEPYVYFAADRRPMSRFIYTYPVLGGSAAAAAARQELFAAWRERLPAVIVVVKREATAESQPSAAREIILPDAPFHALLAGFAPALETSDFILYTPADRGEHWAERWKHARSHGCPEPRPD